MYDEESLCVCVVLWWDEERQGRQGNKNGGAEGI